ncbi:Protein kinase domain-containing protein [Mycena sanguinolenta]|uniref:non-specific serine/threonine protein kinase n=1 Tax=Mycena sanguinolenta TaxID=230812 RepID=A0A8H7CC36_9AGAR|nr:Protein kinase domain-containing protein [Mycena sanguinolenta]
MAQQPGTLVPGQSISVNKYTVQVERYLSQGWLRGFAHVYLVRTATPVYNTTHHVLKRIAVSNDAMLTEVKKEVDIMRLLKGHPNIVHLIDAAWHRMPNGLYEVFILMEFCPGGGIIDMMNRRLRERLTEAEILQIFVDVCEGVAYMHNARPALLHRDLKVENILQSTATSFKLCDFGSATTVAPRPPATVQEIRALEADLNRHTTLQYRAPEMVDPYLRRPVDEKSDVWALGVLLYKLCYYTTPFEEHGPLAILNVQYRIPPYPVYSQQMNALIASMLREHGNQRPSVFELLSIVHRLRGTKSQFTYTIPAPPPPISPRPQQTQFAQSMNPLDSTITYRSQQQPSPSKNAGVQARDKVLEAIAPMRRGRPTTEGRQTASPSRPPPPPPPAKNWLEEEDKAWNAVTVKNGTSAPKRSVLDDAWTTRGGASATATPSKGFGDDFAEKLWDSFDPAKSSVNASPSTAAKAPVLSPPPLRPPAFTGSFTSQRGGKDKDKDAFEGLGSLGGGEKPAPTLGEARLLRTGLAGMSSSSHKYEGISGDYKDYKSSRPLPSTSLYAPQSSSQGQSQGQSLSPNPPPLKPSSSGSSWLSHAPSSMSRPGSGLGDTAESRFPSLEELDAGFTPSPANGHPVPPPRQPVSAGAPAAEGKRFCNGDNVRDGRHAVAAPDQYGHAGHREQPTHGTHDAWLVCCAAVLVVAPHRKHASSDDGSPIMTRALGGLSASHVPPAVESTMTQKSKDWLTGSDEELRTPHAASHSRIATTPANSSRAYGASSATQNASSGTEYKPPSFGSGGDYKPSAGAGTDFKSSSSGSGMDYKSPAASAPVMRQSPGKRTSVIEKAPVHIPEGITVQREHIPPSPNTPSSPTTRAARIFPAIDLNDEPSEQGWGVSGKQKEKEKEKEKEVQKEMESASMNKGMSTQEVGRAKRKSRQSSVHDLVDLYGGAGGLVLPSKEKERVSPSLLEDLTPRKTAFGSGPPAAQQPKSVESKAKRRSTALASVSTANPPSSALSPPNSGRPQPGSPRSGNKASTPTTPASSSGRSPRPQSMFVFPSKQTEPGAASNLSPPEDPKPRSHIRRTSISDMVQRYEAIVQPSVSAAPRAENGRFTSASSQSTSSSSSAGVNGRFAGSTSLPLASSSAGLGDNLSKGANLPPRVSPTGLPRTGTPQREPEIVAPRARRTSYKSIDLMGGGSGPSIAQGDSGRTALTVT